MAGKNKLTQMSGRQFADLVRRELEERNKGLEELTAARLARMSGVSGRRLSQILNAENPNPSAITMRCVLFTLGYAIDEPEHDVVPKLVECGAYDETIHGRHPQFAKRAS
jgi:transcriptional regulator with XRE-family HTH domain